LSFNTPVNVPLYRQQYDRGCQLVQQAMMAEATGQLLAAAQCYDQAAQWLDGSVRSAQQLGRPIWDFAYFSCGYAHFNAAREYAQLGQWQAAPPHLANAIAAMNAAIGVNSQVFYYHSSAGMVLLAQGNPVEATRAFETALGLNPGDAWSQYMLAALHTAQGNTAAATQMYSAAQAAAPGLPPVQQVLPEQMVAPAAGVGAAGVAPAAGAGGAPAQGAAPAQPRWMDVLTKVATVADAVNKIGGAVNTMSGLMGGLNPGAAGGMHAGMGWNAGMGMGMNPGMGWPGMRR
jgi:tetratricopeptide (TPR) repeat protein